ncbi:MAG: hypothetical protein PQJ60_13335, partial [Spirochaetales bacterium]|nr:hypothetical protein [Spirochaetales bacterium]
IKAGDRRTLLRFMVFYVSGVIVCFLPWLVYFLLNGALYDFIYVYLLVNLKFYKQDIGFFRLILFVVRSVFYDGILANPLFGLISLSGLVLVIKGDVLFHRTQSKLTFLSMIILGIIGVFGGGHNYTYYFLLFAPFLVPLALPLIAGAERLLSGEGIHPSSVQLKVAALILVGFLTLSAYRNTANKELMNVPGEDLFQFKFAELIGDDPHSTLLNYGSLDNGLYTTTGLYPPVKYFETQNIEYDQYPVIRDEQDRYVREALCNYILIKYVKDLPHIENEINQDIYERYEEVDRVEQYFEGNRCVYILFKRAED